MIGGIACLLSREGRWQQPAPTGIGAPGLPPGRVRSTPTSATDSGPETAGGRSRPAGSRTARSTANGRPCAKAALATAPLSRSAAAAPVRSQASRLADRVAMISAVARINPPGVPKRPASSGATCQHSPASDTTVLGTISPPAGKSGDSPPASPKLTSARTPEAAKREAANSAPAAPPPPIATIAPKPRARCASASSPTTMPITA